MHVWKPEDTGSSEVELHEFVGHLVCCVVLGSEIQSHDYQCSLAQSDLWGDWSRSSSLSDACSQCFGLPSSWPLRQKCVTKGGRGNTSICVLVL